MSSCSRHAAPGAPDCCPLACFVFLVLSVCPQVPQRAHRVWHGSRGHGRVIRAAVGAPLRQARTRAAMCCGCSGHSGRARSLTTKPPTPQPRPAWPLQDALGPGRPADPAARQPADAARPRGAAAPHVRPPTPGRPAGLGPAERVAPQLALSPPPLLNCSDCCISTAPIVFSSLFPPGRYLDACVYPLSALPLLLVCLVPLLWLFSVGSITPIDINSPTVRRAGLLAQPRTTLAPWQLSCTCCAPLRFNMCSTACGT